MLLKFLLDAVDLGDDGVLALGDVGEGLDDFDVVLEEVPDLAVDGVHLVDALHDLVLLELGLLDDLVVAQGVVVDAEEVDVDVEGADEPLAEEGVQAERQWLGHAHDEGQRAGQQRHDVLVLLLVVVLLHIDADAVVERTHLVRQVVEEDQRPLQLLQLHRVLPVHPPLEPPHQLPHWNVNHPIYY